MKVLENWIQKQITIGQSQPKMTQPPFRIVRPQRIKDFGGIQIFKRYGKYQGRAVHFGHAVTIAFKMSDFDKILTRMVKALAYLESVKDLSELPKLYQRHKPIIPKTTDHDEMMDALFKAERRGLRYVYSDGGRSDAGFEGNGKDCFVRAICHHTGADYREAYDIIYHGNVKNRPDNFVEIGLEQYGLKLVWDQYVVSKKATSWQRTALGWSEQWVWKRISASKAYKVFGDCIVMTYSHAAAIQDGVLLDTFDSRRKKSHKVYKCCSPDEAVELRSKGATLID